jgi:hypothetical protein
MGRLAAWCRGGEKADLRDDPGYCPSYVHWVWDRHETKAEGVSNPCGWDELCEQCFCVWGS